MGKFRSVLLTLALAAVMATVAGAVVYQRLSTAAAEVGTMQGIPMPQPLPPQQVAGAPDPAATLEDTVKPSAAPPSAPAETLPPLPTREVKQRPTHVVADDQPLPIPHVTIQDRNGRILSRPAPAAQQLALAPPPSKLVAPPAPRESVLPPPPPRLTAPPPPPEKPRRTAALPPQRRHSTAPAPAAPALPPIPATLIGPAHATGTISIGVQGHAVRLYGVLPPASTDRCVFGHSDPMPCSDLAEQTLAFRLARSASVSCRLPVGASAATPARVCVDDKGADIAGLLVAEGLAVADRHTSSDYAGAESAAKSHLKGLWRFR